MVTTPSNSHRAFGPREADGVLPHSASRPAHCARCGVRRHSRQRFYATPKPAGPSAAVLADLAPSGMLHVAVQATPWRSCDFFAAKLGVAVAKGHAEGLAYLTQFVEQAKSSGMVQTTIDATGLPALTVAPAE